MSSPSTKATCLSQPVVKSVMVYRNGDPFFPGRRVVIHEKKVSSFDVFLKEVTGGVNASFGAVRNIYTPHGGHRIRQLNEIRSGEHYVAGGREAFKKLNYLDIGEPKKRPPESNNEQLAVEHVKPVTHSRINVSARFRKPLQEPCSIFLIANGDLISPAVRLFIPRKALTQWDRVLEMVTEKVTLRSGAVHRLYTLDGKLVENGLDLENGQFYVAVGRDKFKKLPYSELIFSKSTVRRSYGSKASSLPLVGGSGKSKGSSKSTDTVETVSPQLPKEKEKHGQNQEFKKPVKLKENAKPRTKSQDVPDNEDGVYKAGKKRSEMRGAVEVQEDEDTQMEVPVDQRPAETVDEEENIAVEHKVLYQGEYSAMNGEADPGAETGEAIDRIEEDKEKMNDHCRDAEEGQAHEQAAQDMPANHPEGETHGENGVEMDQNSREEETKEGIDDQTKADSNYEKTSAPRVTITSPQGSEKNEQTNEYATVA